MDVKTICLENVPIVGLFTFQIVKPIAHNVHQCSSETCQFF